MDPLDSILELFQSAGGDTSVVSDVSLTPLFRSFVVQGQEMSQLPNGLDWASVLDVPESNDLGSAPHIPDARPCLYSTPVVQANSDAVGLEYNASASIGFIFNSPGIAVQDGAPLNVPGAEYASGVVLMQGPPTSEAAQISDDVFGYSIAPFAPPEATHENIRCSLNQGVETKIASSSAFSSTGIPSQHWDINKVLEAPVSIENRPTLAFANPVAGTNTSFPEENDWLRPLQSPLDQNHQIIPALQNPANPVHFPSQQPLVQPGGPIGTCEWADDKGVCGEVLTRATLPIHLSVRHGIKNRSRDHKIVCRWVGCKRKGKAVNRESISRHVLEAHLRQKRTPSRANSRSS